MGHELALIVGFTLFSLFVTAAWVSGYLDPYQRKLQDLALNKMGDNRASYGVKSTIGYQHKKRFEGAYADNLRRCYIHTEDRR